MDGLQNAEIAKAIRQNGNIHRYVVAIAHALLWIAALSLAAFFHLSPHFSHPEALLGSTLVAYGAYINESVLGTLKAASGDTTHNLNFKTSSLWGWIVLNIAVCTGLSFLFLANPSWIWLIGIILVAGWQKYMDGRIPPRINDTANKPE